MLKKILAWLDNYWYHYKWTTIIVAFFAVSGIVLISQMATRENYDIQVLYTGPHIFSSTERMDVTAAFNAMLDTDYDGDGRKNTLILDLSAFSDEQAEKAMQEAESAGQMLVISRYSFDAVKQTFSQEMMAGTSFICLLDPYWYNLMKENNALLPLTESIGQKPEAALDDYGIRLFDTDFGTYFSCFAALPEDTVLCMRRMPVASAVSGQKKIRGVYDNHREVFRSIMAFGSH